MKLFVTGGTGFVGSHFINAAHRAGHDIIALRRPGAQPRVPLEREPTWVEGQLDGDYREALQGCEVFVHLASHTPNPPYDTLYNCLYWNVQASIQLAEQAREQGVTRFLVAGSCFEYGRSAQRYPFIPVTAPLEPTLSYPTSKAAASVAFQGLAAQHQLSLKIYRIFQVYGEGEQANRLWPSLRTAALAGEDFPMTQGEQLRDFINVEEVAMAFVKGLDFSQTQPGEPQISHVASGQPQTLLEFAAYWWRVWGAKGRLQPGAVPYRFNEMMRLVPEVDELQ
jgi:nucleoside-diphosphate-sugar epimerase